MPANLADELTVIFTELKCEVNSSRARFYLVPRIGLLSGLPVLRPGPGLEHWSQARQKSLLHLCLNLKGESSERRAVPPGHLLVACAHDTLSVVTVQPQAGFFLPPALLWVTSPFQD